MAYAYQIQHKCVCKNCDSVVIYVQSDIITESENLDFEGNVVAIDKIVKCPNCNSKIIISSETLSLNDNDYIGDYYDDRPTVDYDDYPEYWWEDLDD